MPKFINFHSVVIGILSNKNFSGFIFFKENYYEIRDETQKKYLETVG